MLTKIFDFLLMIEFFDMALILSLFLLTGFICSILKLNIKRYCLLFIYHYLFVLLFYYYSSYFPSDSNKYYKYVIDFTVSFEPGFAFVVIFNKFFAFLGISSYLSFFLINGFIGFLALVIIDLVLIDLSRYFQSSDFGYHVLRFFVFIPTLHFWSAAIGKDVFSIFSIALFIYALSFNKSFLIPVSSIIMFLVRPHVGIVILFAFVLFLLIESFHKSYISKKLIAFIILVSTVLLLYSFNYVGIDITNGPSSIIDFIESRQSILGKGEGSFYAADYNFLYLLFSYVFMPLPPYAHNIFSLIVSLENWILLMVTSYWVVFYFKNSLYFVWSPYIIVAFLVLLVLWCVLGLTSYNAGISSRQKWMFIPILFVIVPLVFKVKANNAYE